MIETQKATIEFNRQVSPSAWHLRLARENFDFKAGELITLYGKNRHACREYTVASGEQDPYLDVIYRLIENGALTPELIQRQSGETLEISGPTGTFTLRDPHRPVVFFATGTGIAPCRAYLRSHPHLSLTLIHGVRNEEDLFFREEWSNTTYFSCVSSGVTRLENSLPGRLTQHFTQFTWPDNAQFYLCGANEMIYEVVDRLTEMGIDRINIFHEPYYYRWDD